MKKSFIVFSLLITFTAFSQDQWKNVYTESAWTERDKWQKPQELIKQLNIKKGSVVADVGSHEGYMTFKLSETVGETGKVYAVDTEQSKLNKLQAHITQRKATNITLTKGEVDNPKLPVDSFDAIIILDTYHEMKDHDKILQYLKNALKQDGRLVLCEPIADERRRSMRAGQESKHELGMNFALDDLEKAGFKIINKQDPFADREKIKGDKMWLIVAMK